MKGDRLIPLTQKVLWSYKSAVMYMLIPDGFIWYYIS